LRARNLGTGGGGWTCARTEQVRVLSAQAENGEQLAKRQASARRRSRTDSEGAPRETLWETFSSSTQEGATLVLVAWPTICGYRPKAFRHYQIGILTLQLLHG
jgi:hypothetical protein